MLRACRSSPGSTRPRSPPRSSSATPTAARCVRERPRAAPGGHRGAPGRTGSRRCEQAGAAALLDRVAALSVGGAAARHGRARRRRRGRAPGAAVERHALRAARPPTSPRSSAGRRRGPTPSGWCRSPASPSPSCAGSRAHEPDAARRVAQVCLPHDWLTTPPAARRAAGHRPRRRLRHRLLVAGHRRVPRGPARAGARPASPACRRCSTRTGPPAPPRPAPSSRAGTGDNMAAALGLGLGAGRRRGLPRHQRHGVRRAGHAGRRPARGTVAGFADATGRFLPLVATLNAARVLTDRRPAARHRPRRPRRARPRAPRRAPSGLVLLPYLDGERTPDLPHASGTLLGMRRANTTPADLARAAVEGMLCGLADGLARAARAGRCRCAGCCSSAAPRSPPPCRPSRPACSTRRCSCPTPGRVGRAGRRPPGRVGADRAAPRLAGRRRRAGGGRRRRGVREQYAAARSLVHPLLPPHG